MCIYVNRTYQSATTKARVLACCPFREYDYCPFRKKRFCMLALPSFYSQEYEISTLSAPNAGLAQRAIRRCWCLVNC